MSQQEVQPPSCLEQREEFKVLVEKAAKLAAMTRTPGWKEVLQPMLVDRQKGMVKQLCVETDHGQVLRLQAGIQEVDAILGFVAATIEMATAAQASLEEGTEQ